MNSYHLNITVHLSTNLLSVHYFNSLLSLRKSTCLGKLTIKTEVEKGCMEGSVNSLE